MTLCPDCPDLMADRMPADWKPRSICCRDEHIQRRLDGSHDTFPGIEEARRAWDEPKPAGPNRRERRAQAKRERRARAQS